MFDALKNFLLKITQEIKVFSGWPDLKCIFHTQQQTSGHCTNYAPTQQKKITKLQCLIIYTFYFTSSFWLLCKVLSPSHVDGSEWECSYKKESSWNDINFLLATHFFFMMQLSLSIVQYSAFHPLLLLHTIGHESFCMQLKLSFIFAMTWKWT